MIYLDNASTSYPKPEEVVNGVNELICNSAGSSMRTANTEKVDIIFKTRELVAKVLNVKYPTSIVFTANATESLNSIIDGFLSEGDTVVTTAIEHNSVIRPLNRLKHEKCINIKWIKSDKFGYVNPDELLNQVGIGSLYYGISYLNQVGIKNISTRLLDKTNLLITNLKKLDHVTVYSKPNSVGIVSFNVDEVIPSRLSTFLLEDYDIKTRSGLMCAPFIHEFLGTNPYGCIRVSLSIKNTERDILDFVEAIRKVTQNYNDIRNIRIPDIYSSPETVKFFV